MKSVAWGGRNMLVKGVGSARQDVLGSKENSNSKIIKEKAKTVIGVRIEISWFGQIARK